MDEANLDRLRKRASINPELAGRKDIVELAESLNKMIQGEEIGVSISGWSIDNINSPSLVTLSYIKHDLIVGLFAFTTDVDGQSVTFTNEHRAAKYGWGVTAFTELEHIAAALATIQKKPVKFIFPLYNQNDTEDFLTRRGYEFGYVSDDPAYLLLQTLEKIFRPV